MTEDLGFTMERNTDERISGEEMRMLIGDEESDNEMDHISINGLSTLMGYGDNVHSTTSDTDAVDRDEAKEFGAKLDAAMSRFWERENEITRVRSARPFSRPAHSPDRRSLTCRRRPPSKTSTSRATTYRSLASGESCARTPVTILGCAAPCHLPEPSQTTTRLRCR